ncbi:MAG: hypothetical protein J6T46_04280 [Victivallales bacterium]|nr:hypothetical protein [Victivallales bacterium]
MTILATEYVNVLNRFNSLVAETAGHDMNNYQGLDIDEEFEAIIQEPPQAYEPNWE